MEKIVERFRQRLSLPEGVKFDLKNFIANTKYNSTNEQVLELYHGVRDNINGERIKSILDSGFVISRYGNKGVGVYLANHSKYSLWAGISGSNKCFNAIVCHVIDDGKSIRRYRSEIISPQTWDSEFVITNPEIIYPKYVIEYNLIVDKKI